MSDVKVEAVVESVLSSSDIQVRSGVFLRKGDKFLLISVHDSSREAHEKADAFNKFLQGDER